MIIDGILSKCNQVVCSVSLNLLVNFHFSSSYTFRDNIFLTNFIMIFSKGYFSKTEDNSNKKIYGSPYFNYQESMHGSFKTSMHGWKLCCTSKGISSDEYC